MVLIRAILVIAIPFILFGCQSQKARNSADLFISIEEIEEMKALNEGLSGSVELYSIAMNDQVKALLEFDTRHTQNLRQKQVAGGARTVEIIVDDMVDVGDRRGFILRSGRSLGHAAVEEIDDVVETNEVILPVFSGLDLSALHKFILGLPESSSILYYIENEGKLGAYLITRKGVFYWDCLESALQVQRQVDDFRRAILMEAKMGERSVSREELGQEIFREIIPPSLALHQPVLDHVLIIPSESLGRLPFTALQDEMGRYLVESYVIHHYPSLQLLLDSAGHKPVWPSIYAVGNPLLRIAGGDLPGAEKEAQLCAETMQDRMFVTGARATENHFYQNAHKYGVVHLACHFGLNVDNVLESAFLLSSDEKSDGYLTIQEILDAGFTWNLMVLSACETGVAPKKSYVSDSSFWGASHYLLGRVTPSLVTTLWSIDNDATIQFMSLFYSRLAIGNEAETLQQVQKSFIQSTDHWSLPFYWAPFSFHGGGI